MKDGRKILSLYAKSIQLYVEFDSGKIIIFVSRPACRQAGLADKAD